MPEFRFADSLPSSKTKLCRRPPSAMLTYVPFGITTWLVGLLTFLLAWMMLHRPKGIPPGPLLKIPLLGHLPFVKGNILDWIEELRKKYGDIFHLYLGPELAITLNGYDVIKEALLQNGEVFSNRPPFKGMEELGAQKGLVSSSGAVWKEHRKFALEALREFGFGRNILQEKIQEEITYYLEAIEGNRGETFDIKNLIQTAVSNVTCNIVFGKRFMYSDPKFLKHLHNMDEVASRGPETFVNISILNKLPGDIYGFKANKRCILEIRQELVEASIKEHLENFHPDCINDFIDAYIKEMKEKEQQGGGTAITIDYLWTVIMDLFFAGTETTATTIRWALVYLLNYPKLQERLHKELLDRVGSGRFPSLEDRPQLPLLNAFIMEVQRMANIVPLAVPHATSVDFLFRGHRIPKDAMIFINLESVLKDPKLWDQPYVFNPERFLKDGKVVKPEYFIPFGTGRRVCLGESLAKMELFLFLAPMLQRFRFEPAENQPPPETKGTLGSVHTPKPFQLKALLRS